MPRIWYLDTRRPRENQKKEEMNMIFRALLCEIHDMKRFN